MPACSSPLSVRTAFDPRAFEKILAKRNEETQESAARFADDFKAGLLSASEPGALSLGSR